MIPTQREPRSPKGWRSVLERCFFCRARTAYWTNLPDRPMGEQVACCRPCGLKAVPEDVPTKAAWFARDETKEALSLSELRDVADGVRCEAAIQKGYQEGALDADELRETGGCLMPTRKGMEALARNKIPLCDALQVILERSDPGYVASFFGEAPKLSGSDLKHLAKGYPLVAAIAAGWQSKTAVEVAPGRYRNFLTPKGIEVLRRHGIPVDYDLPESAAPSNKTYTTAVSDILTDLVVALDDRPAVASHGLRTAIAVIRCHAQRLGLHLDFKAIQAKARGTPKRKPLRTYWSVCLDGKWWWSFIALEDEPMGPSSFWREKGWRSELDRSQAYDIAGEYDGVPVKVKVYRKEKQ